MDGPWHGSRAWGRKIDEAQRKAGSFSVVVFFWADILGVLGDYPEVARKHYESLFLPLVGTSTYLPPQGLEVVVKAEKEVDYVALIPAFSSADPARAADLAVLAAGLSDIEIINHGDRPTEILRLWLGLEDPRTQGEIKPREIKEENLTGIRRIEAWSRQRYRLEFTSVFAGSPQQDWRQRVMLGVKAIGIGELHVRLEDFFQENDEPEPATA